jgi:alkyl hydroperoxide reductase subunit AhpC
VLRVLDALQTDELCPCNWKKGEETIDVNVATAKNEKQNAVSN